MTIDVQSVTNLLTACRAGEKEAFDALVNELYDELRELAHIQLRLRSPGETLNTTALVNELYCKLAGQEVQSWTDRDHFYAVCATTMRHLLVDAARHKIREKRGGGEQALTLDEGCIPAEADPEWLVELDRLMDCLAEYDARLVSVFECRYFGGYTTSETARILSLSERTVERDWARARGWLRSALDDALDGPGK